MTQPTSESSAKFWLRAALILTVLGWLLSGYLLFVHVERERAFGGACVGCGAALSTRAAWQWQFPLAGWGFAFFAFLACLLSIEKRRTIVLAWLSAGIGAGVSIVLSLSIFLSGASWCTACLAIHATSLMVFAVLWRLSTTSARSISEPTSWRSTSFRHSAVALLAVGAGVTLQAVTAPPGHDAAQVRVAFRANTKHEISIDPVDPLLGSRGAPAQLHVFNSFQCPGCQAFAPIVRRLNAEFGSSLTVVFKHYPLGRACNTAVSVDLHPRACAAAWAAEAANRQGRFVPFHDGLFASSLEASEELLRGIGERAGLDMRRFEVERNSDAVREKVQQDIQLGQRLGIDATPTVFLNGRRVPEPTLPALEMLIAGVIRGRFDSRD